MSAKTNAEVVIGGKVLTLSGYEEPEYLQNVASYVNQKIAELEAMESYKFVPTDMRSILLELNIADDYFKAKERVEKLELDLEHKEKELYDLKHDLISSQLRTEEAEESAKKLEASNKKLETSNKELESSNKELLLNKTRLEAALEDKLLDHGKGSNHESQEPSRNNAKVVGKFHGSKNNNKSEDKNTETN